MNIIKSYFSNNGTVTKKTAKAWIAADPFRQSVVVSYYSIFSIPALLMIIIIAVGFAFGREVLPYKDKQIF